MNDLLERMMTLVTDLTCSNLASSPEGNLKSGNHVEVTGHVMHSEHKNCESTHIYVSAQIGQMANEEPLDFSS